LVTSLLPLIDPRLGPTNPNTKVGGADNIERATLYNTLAWEFLAAIFLSKLAFGHFTNTPTLIAS